MASSEVNPLPLSQDDSGSDTEILELHEEERALRAQADAVRAKKMQKLLARKAEQKLHDQQRDERIDSFLGFLRKHDTTKFIKRFTSDPNLLPALRLVAEGKAETKDLVALSGPLLGFFVGTKEHWHSVAALLLADTVDAPLVESTNISNTNVDLPEAINADDQTAPEGHPEDTIIVSSNIAGPDADTNTKDLDNANGSTKRSAETAIKLEKRESAEPTQPANKRLKLTTMDDYVSRITPALSPHASRFSVVNPPTPTSARKTVQFAKADTISLATSPVSRVSTPSKDTPDAKTATPRKGTLIFNLSSLHH